MGSDLDIMDFGVHCHAISVTFFHGSACLMACAGKTLVCIWSCLFFGVTLCGRQVLSRVRPAPNGLSWL